MDNTALDKLPYLTDVVLLGRAPISDGKMHFSSLLCSSEVEYEVVRGESKQQLLECAYIYTLAKSYDCVESGSVKEKAFEKGLESMLSSFGFDRKGVDMKIRSLYYINNEENGIGYACVESTVGDFRIALTDHFDIVDSCKLFRLNGNVEKFTEGDLMLARNYTRDADSIGERALAVISERDGEMIFEGIISFCEKSASEYLEVKEIFDQKNIRVTIMIDDENNYNLNCITRLGIDEQDILCASKHEIRLDTR